MTTGEPFEEDALDNPLTIAGMFWAGLIHDEAGPAVEDLRMITTPESIPAWGDYGWARELLNGKVMLSGLERWNDGCVYVRFADDPGLSSEDVYQVQEDRLMVGGVIMTLLYRPEISMWKVHGLGDYWRPEEWDASR